jgi:hypothetical protein
LEDLHVGLDAIKALKRETGRQQGIFQTRWPGYVQALTIAKSPGTPGGREHFVLKRSVNNAQVHSLIGYQGNADGDNGQTVDKVGGAVQWIHHPTQSAISSWNQPFLGLKVGLGEQVPKPLYQKSFASQVHLGHQISSVLEMNFVGLKIPASAKHEISALPGQGLDPCLDLSLPAFEVFHKWLTI